MPNQNIIANSQGTQANKIHLFCAIAILSKTKMYASITIFKRPHCHPYIMDIYLLMIVINYRHIRYFSYTIILGYELN